MLTFARVRQGSPKCSPAEPSCRTDASSRIRIVLEQVAGALAAFCASFYSVGFDFDLGEKLLGDRRQLSSPAYSDNHRRKPWQWDRAHSGRRSETRSAVSDVRFD